MVKAGGAKAYRLTTFQVGGNDIEPPAQLAEIVGPPEHAESPLQVFVQPLVVEQPRRRRLGQNGHRLQQILVVGIVDEPAQCFPDQARHRGHTPQVFANGRPIEDFGMEGMHLRLVLDEDPAQLRRGHLVGQIGCHEGARTNADIDVEVIEVDSLEGLVQGPQGADFVDASQGSAAPEGQTDSRFLIRRLLILLCHRIPARCWSSLCQKPHQTEPPGQCKSRPPVPGANMKMGSSAEPQRLACRAATLQRPLDVNYQTNARD